MPLNDFTYGVGAVVAPDQQDSFDTCTQNLIADTRPANFLEQLIVDQLLHAQWEQNRINALTAHADAAETLLAASARANRNWNRANRELAALQTARASHELCRMDFEPVAPPCAELTKVPKRRFATSEVVENHIDHLMSRYPPAPEAN